MDEKRRFSRVPFVIVAHIDWQNKKLQGKVGNLSLRGMFIQVPEAVPIGEILSLTLKLTGDTSDLKVALTGKVVRATPEGIGLELEHIDLDSFIHLRNIVAYNSGNADQVDQEFMSFIKQRGSAAS